MRNLITLSLLLILTVIPLWGQSGTTVVTATVVDTNGSLYINCQWSVVFVGENTTPGAGPYKPETYTHGQQGQCDSQGNFSVNLGDNLNTITPTPSQWSFSICSAPGYPQGPFCKTNILITVTGSTQNITSTLTPLMPLLPTTGSGGTMVFPGIPTGACTAPQTAVNQSNGDFYACNGGAWNKVGPGTGGGGMADPGANGPIKRTAPNVTAPALASDIINLWIGGATCDISTFMRGDGQCASPPAGNPASPANSLQINNGGVFGSLPLTLGQVAVGTSGTPIAQSKSVADVRDYYAGNGVKCDGSSHPLSAFYGSLGAAQAVYPFITSLTQELDYAAIKASANVAFGPDGSEHGTNTKLNIPLLLPSGTCMFGNDTLLIRNADGISIQGSAKTSTILQGNRIVLGFDGLWYSKLSDFEVITSSNTATVAMDVDGNVPGHPYSTRTVQGNLLQNILVGGGGSSYALAFCRQGGNNAQCSEDTMINIHLSNASSAALYINGFNALDNVWIGGDIQTYTKDGIFLSNSTLREVGVSFEPVGGCGQLNNGGFDIHASGGVGGTIVVTGSRTEGLSFLSATSVNAVITGFQQNAALSTWTANAAVTSAEAIEKTGTDGLPHLFCATTPGTSSNVQPTWPPSGTVNDGTAVWTATPFTVINIAGGLLDYTSATIDPAATVSWQNWTSALGAYTLTSTGLVGAGSFDISKNNPSGVSIEHVLQAANASYTLDLFTNAHGSTFASQFQTMPALPAQSVGILGRGGVTKLYLGDNLYEGAEGTSALAQYHFTTTANVDGTFAPTINADPYSSILLQPTINQTGTSSGSATIFADYPVLTSTRGTPLLLGIGTAASVGGVRTNKFTVDPSGNTVVAGTLTATGGSFTTLSASSTVSGAGFTSLFASPPAIGGTVPAAGTFVALTGATYNTSTNCSANGTAANPSIVGCSSASAGAFSCDVAASATTCTVNTTAVTANSQINVWLVSDEGARLGVTCNTSPSAVPVIYVATKTAASSFVINMPTITTNPACFDYTITN